MSKTFIFHTPENEQAYLIEKMDEPNEGKFIVGYPPTHYTDYEGYQIAVEAYNNRTKHLCDDSCLQVWAGGQEISEERFEIITLTDDDGDWSEKRAYPQPSEQPADALGFNYVPSTSNQPAGVSSIIHEIAGKRYILVEIPVIEGSAKQCNAFIEKHGMIFQGVRKIDRGGWFGKTIIIQTMLLPEERFNDYSKDRINY